MKPELELFAASTIAPVPMVSDDPSVKSTKRTLSHDPTSRDETLLLHHPAGDEWGWKTEGSLDSWSGGTHVYWEEVYIVKGRIWDGNTAQWYEAGSYCCRPPGMFHGPFKADPIEGCDEVVFVRYVQEGASPRKELKRTYQSSSAMLGAPVLLLLCMYLFLTRTASGN
ncbi:hypothetical protein DL93DRAFT_1104772 [Clavulina sp. PMI_390]|nr:hypothetical protein DL93DRAFT_1104772 [Clavulina sp. PMI_390]